MRQRHLLGTILILTLAPPMGCGGFGSHSSSPEYATSDYSYTPATPPPPSSDATQWVVEEAPVYRPSARLLTAGMVPDADRRAEYLSYVSRSSDMAQYFGVNLGQRVRVRVVDAHGEPVNDARIEIDGPSGSRVWGRTHADGIFDAYPGLWGTSLAGMSHITVTKDGFVSNALVSLAPTGDSPTIEIGVGTLVAAPNTIDLGFLIDVTGSMEDELRYVNAEVGDIVQRIRAAAPSAQVRVGATLYRDRGDFEPLRVVRFSEDVSWFAEMLANVNATGGGDYPEDLYSGLEEALTGLDWSTGNSVRVLCIIADAPPQNYGTQFAHHEALRVATERGIRLLPVAASGANTEVEYLFRALATATSTPYVYLSDDSGIGNPHLEPDTDRVTVELFNDLLTRLVIDDLLGYGMHAPDFQEQPVAFAQ